MSRLATWTRRWSLVAMVGATFALAACGSDSDDDSTGTAGGGGGGADVAAAKAEVAPFIGKPSPFPVTEPLEERPDGALVAFMDPGTPVGSLLWEFLKPAAQTMGVEVQRFKAGPAQNVTTAGFDAALAAEPDILITGAVDPSRWAPQLEQFQEMGTSVVGTGISNGAEYGLEPVNGGPKDMERNGRLMADYVVGHMTPNANVAMFDIAELPFTKELSAAFEAELESICPDCSVRTTSLQAATIGNTSVNAIVSDLQANSDTNVAVFASDELQHGLPDALSKAGIEVLTLGFAPDPVNLQQLKEEKETAVLGTDLITSVWTILDQGARQLTGQELTGPEAEGYSVIQFLTPKDITFDPQFGWSGYPDFAQRFAELWGVEPPPAPGAPDEGEGAGH